MCRITDVMTPRVECATHWGIVRAVFITEFVLLHLIDGSLTIQFDIFYNRELFPIRINFCFRENCSAITFLSTQLMDFKYIQRLIYSSDKSNYLHTYYGVIIIYKFKRTKSIVVNILCIVHLSYHQ